jgi:4-hydroxy-3-polyprenylbenzoate decarboxylase
MAYNDLRGFIEEVEKKGELKTIEGAHWDKEIGGISELMAERNGPALLFDKIQGYPKGYRVLSNAFLSLNRMGLVLGLPGELSAVEMVDGWRKRLKEIKPVCPREVKDAPITQNILTGQEVDLYKLPAPVWHELDSGRFIGTGCAVITRDPDEDWVNLGTYRCRIFDKNHLSVSMNPGKHGPQMMEKYHARGESFPVAIAFGMDPVLFLAACTPHTGWRQSEYDFAGGIKGQPIDVIKGAITGLPLPATAEIVIEGEIPPPPKLEKRADVPYGEWSRVYAMDPSRPYPLVEVKSMLFRNDPIILGVPTWKPHIPFPFQIPLMAAEIWNVLEYAGIPDVKGVWFGLGIVWPVFCIISIKQNYAGHAMQAALAAASCKANTNGGLFVIVVDEDIDITNEKDIMLTIANRANPDNILVIHGLQTRAKTPKKMPNPGEEPLLVNDRIIIDACWPYERRKNFPVTNQFSQQYQKEILKKWKSLF